MKKLVWNGLIVTCLFAIPLLGPAQVSQNADPLNINFIPPSPTAYELGKYGQIPVGLFTGTPNVNIPIYTYSTNNLSVPISLSYNSNGIKVDQMASWVGLGWSLNAGGVVTRIIRDLPDESYRLRAPEMELDVNDYQDPYALDFFEAAVGETVDTERDLYMFNFNGYSGKFVIDDEGSVLVMPYQNLIVRGAYEVDESTGNVSKSGFEVITPDGVRYTFLDAESSFLNGSCTSDIDQQYKQSAWYLTNIIHPKGDTITFDYEQENYRFIQGISETKMVPAAIGQGCAGGADCPPQSLSQCQPESNVRGLRLKKIRSNSPYKGSVIFNAGTSNPEVIGNFNFLDGISILDQDEAEIDRFDFNYQQTFAKRTFLESVDFLDPDKKYAFEYITPSNLPERLSYSQDLWGYYNSVFNSVFYPRIEGDPYFLDGANRNPDGSQAQSGLLKSIIYPTKGFTEFQYESNDIYETSTVYTSVPLPGIDLETGNSLTEIFTVPVNLSDGLPPYESTISLRIFEQSENPCNTLDNIWLRARLLDKTTNQYLTMNGSILLEASALFEPTEAVVNFTPGHEYELELTKSMDCLYGIANILYYTVETVVDNVETGGLRISKAMDHNTATDVAEVRKYYYGNKDELNISSADPGREGYFITDGTIEIPCAIANHCEQCSYKQVSSNSLTPLFNTGNNNVYYKYVTISHGGDNFENGGEEHEFIINRDQAGSTILSIYAHIPENSTISNTGWNHGLEVSNKTFSKANDGTLITIQDVRNYYKRDERYGKESINYNAKKRYQPVCSTPPLYYVCQEEDVNDFYIGELCTTDHGHSWIAPNGIGKTQVCFAEGHENRFAITPIVNYVPIIGLVTTYDVDCTTAHQHVYQDIKRKNIFSGYTCGAFDNNHLISINYNRCHFVSAGDTIYSSAGLEHMNIIKFKDLSYWHYLDSTSVTQYDPLGANPITTHTKFIYDNPEHIQLTRQVTTDSEGKVLETRVKYPQDYDSLSRSAALDSMYYRHIIDPVIEQIQKVNGQVVSATGTRYEHNLADDIVLPKDIYLYETTQPGLDFTESHDGENFPAYAQRATYHQYDDKGNVLEFSKEDDVRTVYLWGYNQTYPIAQVVNASYNEAIGELGPGDLTLLQGNTLTDVEIRAKIDLIRQALPDALVTCYTYDPLVGMTSSTDPRGILTEYQYDDFNRLELVKDHKGNIVQKYEYKYGSDGRQ